MGFELRPRGAQKPRQRLPARPWLAALAGVADAQHFRDRSA